MTRAEIEAAAKANQGEAKLLVLAVGLLLDIREELDGIRCAVIDVESAIEKSREAADSAWTRAKPEPKPPRKGSR